MRKIAASLLMILMVFFSGCGVDYNEKMAAADAKFEKYDYVAAEKIYTEIAEKCSNESLKSKAKEKLKEIEKEQKRKEEIFVQFNQDYAKVMTDILPDLVVGAQIRNESLEWVVVYVSPFWYSLNDDYKKAVVGKCLAMYRGMLGARGIKVNENDLSLFVKSATDGKSLATWGSIRGIVLE